MTYLLDTRGDGTWTPLAATGERLPGVRALGDVRARQGDLRRRRQRRGQRPADRRGRGHRPRPSRRPHGGPPLRCTTAGASTTRRCSPTAPCSSPAVPAVPGFNDVSPGKPVHAAELWDPATDAWTTLAAEAVDRCYHATARAAPRRHRAQRGRRRVHGGPGAQRPRRHPPRRAGLPPALPVPRPTTGDHVGTRTSSPRARRSPSRCRARTSPADAPAPRLGHARHRHEPALRPGAVHGRGHHPHRHAPRRAGRVRAGALHALRAERGRGAVGGGDRPHRRLPRAADLAEAPRTAGSPPDCSPPTNPPRHPGDGGPHRPVPVRARRLLGRGLRGPHRAVRRGRRDARTPTPPTRPRRSSSATTGLPDLDAWPAQLARSANGSYAFRGVELTVEGDVERRRRRPRARRREHRPPIRLRPLEQVLAWDLTARRPRAATAEERAAFGHLADGRHRADNGHPHEIRRGLVAGGARSPKCPTFRLTGANGRN